MENLILCNCKMGIIKMTAQDYFMHIKPKEMDQNQFMSSIYTVPGSWSTLKREKEFLSVKASEAVRPLVCRLHVTLQRPRAASQASYSWGVAESLPFASLFHFMGQQI